MRKHIRGRSEHDSFVFLYPELFTQDISTVFRTFIYFIIITPAILNKLLLFRQNCALAAWFVKKCFFHTIASFYNLLPIFIQKQSGKAVNFQIMIIFQIYYPHFLLSAGNKFLFLMIIYNSLTKGYFKHS